MTRLHRGVALAAAALGLFVPSAAHAASPDVVISEVYGGGGNAGATYTNDFIELRNDGTTTVDLSAYSVQYASAAGTSWQKTNLSGTLAAGKSYLVQEAQGSGGTTPLPTAQAIGTIAMSGTAGKVALVANQTALSCGAACHAAAGVVDFIGYGSANDFEGAAPAPAPSNTLSDNRAGQDSDQNGTDFATGDPSPAGATAPPADPAVSASIADVQGKAFTSPLAGKAVKDVTGVVTAVGSNRFYIESASPAAGVQVFTSSAPTVAVGDAVTVAGKVQEYVPGGTATNQTVTEITGPTVTRTGTAELPPPVLVGPGGVQPPSSVFSTFTGNTLTETPATFDPATEGLDFWESLEGRRVTIEDPAVVGPTDPAYDETEVVPAGAGVRSARGGIVAQADDFNPERIRIVDTLAPVPHANVGDHYAGAVTGVVDYDFGMPTLLPTSTPTRVDGGIQPETTKAPAAGQLAVATFNVENLDPQDPQSKFDALAGQIVGNLQSPDLLALEEVQDNDGATDDGVVAADQTIAKLTAAIQAAGGPAYQSTSIDPVDDQDGGEPGGNIRQAFLYRTDRGLSFTSKPGGDATTPVAVQDGPQLSVSPGRIAPASDAWKSSRKPLAGQFAYGGKPLFVVANHFNSKGGDEPLFGRNQPPARPSEAQRKQQATLVRGFVDDVLAKDANAQVVVLGDLNDFDFSAAVHVLTDGGGLVDLPATLPVPERYTYVYEGNSEVLDHVLLSPALAAKPYDYDVVHVNAEFSEQTSDHDPQVVRLGQAVAPTTPTLAQVPASVARTATRLPVTVACPSAHVGPCVGTITVTSGGKLAGLGVYAVARGRSGATQVVLSRLRLATATQLDVALRSGGAVVDTKHVPVATAAR